MAKNNPPKTLQQPSFEHLAGETEKTLTMYYGLMLIQETAKAWKVKRKHGSTSGADENSVIGQDVELQLVFSR